MIQMQLWEDLDHASYSGVAFINDLMQTRNTREIMSPGCIYMWIKCK